MRYHVVHGAFDKGKERDFAGTNLYDPSGNLFAFVGPFHNPQPLEDATYLLNSGVITADRAKTLLSRCASIYVV